MDGTLQVFQLFVDMQTDVPNVMYFNLIEFLLQKIDLKLELSHVVLVAEFIRRVGKPFKRNLIK